LPINKGTDLVNIVDQALQTQLSNIQIRSGKTLDQLTDVIKASGLTKHGEIRDMLKRDLGLGHGDANTLTHYYLGHAGVTHAAGEAAPPSPDATLDDIYSGPKGPLRPIHEKVMAAIDGLGPFEIAPKKGYLSLRRKKQFAMLGPGSNTRVDLGLNMKGVPPTERLIEEKPGGMCQYKVKLTDPAEVDNDLIGWIKTAYDSAG
jgi:hypothetical protein